MAEIGWKELFRYFSPTDFPYFVSQMRYLVHTKGNPYRTMQERIIAILMAVYLLRAVAAFIVILFDLSDWFPFVSICGNHVLRNVSVKLFFNYTFVAFFFLLLIFIIINYWLIIWKTEVKYWHELYNVTVVNYEQFIKHNLGYLKSLLDSIPVWFGPSRKLIFYYIVMNRLYQGDPGFTFGSDRLPVMLGSSLRTRTRFIRILFWNEITAIPGSLFTSERNNFNYFLNFKIFLQQ